MSECVFVGICVCMHEYVFACVRLPSNFESSLSPFSYIKVDANGQYSETDEINVGVP